jgi:hypothetical protein
MLSTLKINIGTPGRKSPGDHWTTRQFRGNAMTQITQAQTASTRSEGDFDRLVRLPARVSAPSSLLRRLLRALDTVQRRILTSRQEEEALLRLDQLDEHQLHDVGLVRVEEVVGWQIAARGAAPTAITRFSYQRLPSTENNHATASPGFAGAEPAGNRRQGSCGLESLSDVPVAPRSIPKAPGPK